MILRGYTPRTQMKGGPVGSAQFYGAVGKPVLLKSTQLLV